MVLNARVVAMNEVNGKQKMKLVRVKTSEYDCWVSVEGAEAAGLAGDVSGIG